MSGTEGVRLIRCPNCEKLLPEITHFSVYECGNCGAVLKAKNKGVDQDAFSENSDEESIRETAAKLPDRYEKMANVSGRRKIDVSDDSENDMRSNISSSSRAQRTLRDRAENNTLASLTSEEERWAVEAREVIRDKRSVEFQRAKMSPGPQYQENETGLRRPGRMLEGRHENKGVVEGFTKTQRRDGVLIREDPSDVLSRSDYDNGSPARNKKNVDGHGNNDYIGEDRAELLKQLDVLQEKLSRSGNLIDKGNGKVPQQRKMAPQNNYVSEDWYAGTSLEMNQVGMQNSYHQYAQPPPLIRRQEMGNHGFYPPQYAPNHVWGYGGPSRPHMHRRDPRHAPAYHQTSLPHVYRSGPFQDDDMVDMDAIEPYPVNYNRHHPSCSCYQCLNQTQVAAAPFLPTAYSDKYSDPFSYHDSTGSFCSRYHNHRFLDHPPLRSHNSQSHARWPSDVDSEVSGFVHRRPPRVHLASGGKHCSPVAGAAPFLICYNCSELLLFSKKVLTKNNRNKVRCGACSVVIVVAISEKSLAVSIDLRAKDNPIKVENKPGVLLRSGDANQTTFLSNEYDSSGCDFQYMDRKHGQLSTGHESVNKSMEMKVPHHSTSSYASESEEELECLATTEKDSISADHSKSKVQPPSFGSSLQDHFEHSNKYRVVDPPVEQSLIGHSEHEQALGNKKNAQQLSRNESSATEINLSSNEFDNSGTTFDSGEASRGRENLNSSKKAKSFFFGIEEENYKESNRSDESFEEEKARVTVNGHLMPDQLIKKAQKLAGPINPGNYWYDFRAGFWGALGGPCLGIIPPFIEEFNYPMPENCGGGNTRVFVNGRELSEKDLNLLAARGLPKERERSYIIEISGRVLDEGTGEELEGLGKLAPTVERMKRGFGMRAPKAAAA